MRLNGKIAIVTGGLSGIGNAIALRMVEEGAQVIAADISSQAKLLSGEPLVPFHVDVSDPQSVETLVNSVVERHGRIDCLVNCAGIGKEIPFLDTPLETFDRVIAINLRGTFIVGQAAAKVMHAKGTAGCIVNIASVSGMVGNVGRSAYGTSKGGVIILTQVMAVDLAAFHIRVNAISPGPVETALAREVHSEERRRQWTDSLPMHRYAQPEEIAGAAVFLCSSDASFITGHVLVVDGGFVSSGLLA